MKTSIIILNWNTLKYLKRCINSIKKNTHDYELIIIDNGSSEKGTKEYIKKIDDKYIFNEKNIGFAAGNNQGAKISDNELICFMNSDIIVGPNWLNELKNTLISHPHCVAVGPLANPKSGTINGTLFNFTQYKGQYTKDIIVKILIGFCILIRSDIFKEIWFDEELKICEDNLLSSELNKVGELWISANANVNHPKPGRTFESNNIDYASAISENIKLLQDKLK